MQAGEGPSGTAGRREIVVVADRPALAAEGVRQVVAAVAARPDGPVAIALCGGSTPRELYRALAAQPLPWERLHWFWGDERCVPPTDPESNYRMACETLLDHAPVPPGNVHRIPCERPPAEAAQAYARELAAWPRLDLVLLGLGAEGHTASLFPESPAFGAAGPVEAVFVPPLRAWRVTLTPPLLSAAWRVLFVVAGADKAPAVRSALTEPRDPRRRPAQGVRAADVRWLLDREAAAALPPALLTGGGGEPAGGGGGDGSPAGGAAGC